MSSPTCLVCQSPGWEFKQVPLAGWIGYRCECTRCGVFDVDQQFLDVGGLGALEPRMRLRLSAAIRAATDRDGRLKEIIRYVSLPTIAETVPVPRDPIDQLDLFVELVAKRAPSFSDFTTDFHVVWAARLQLSDASAAVKLALSGKDAGLFTVSGGASVGNGPILELGLTMNGWERARELRRTRGPGNQAFVAMWFHGGMDAIFHDAIRPALEETGYSAYRVDMADHNNKIDDEIFAQLRRSRLLVADATGARNSVYYEAGFAAGLGLPVLWCCNGTYRAYAPRNDPDMASKPALVEESWFKQVAFDTRQHPFIEWSDAAGLKARLLAKIRGLGLDLTPGGSAAFSAR